MAEFLDEKRKELFAAIGEFIYWFSDLEAWLRSRIYRESGIKSELYDIITGPYDFAMLCTILEKILLKDANSSQTKEIKKFISECREINNMRVKIVHGTWSIRGLDHVARQTLENTRYRIPAADILMSAKRVQDLSYRCVLLPDKPTN